MTFDAREASLADARPAELYRWTHAAEVIAATSADQELVHAGETYTPTPLERAAIVQGDEMQRADLAVTVPAAHPVAQLFAGGPPVDRVRLVVYRRHLGDGETVAIWRGRVLSCEWRGIEAVLTHEPDWTAIRRPGLRRTYGHTCSHVLGDPHTCRVDLSAYATAGTVSAASGVSVTVPAAASQADGWWRGGYLLRSVPTTGRQYRAMITDHSGEALTLHLPLGLAAGDAVSLYPGCDRSLDTCAGKFRNAANFGGFPWTPTQSPYRVTIY